MLDEELADQPLARDDAVRADEEQCEERPLLRPADRDGFAVDAYDQGAENPEFEAAPHGAGEVSLRRGCIASSGDHFGTGLGHRPGIVFWMLYTAKCYWPGVTEGAFRLAAARAGGKPVGRPQTVFRGALYLPGDDLVLGLYESSTRMDVKRASDGAGMPCERVIEAVWVGPNSEGGSTRWGE
jgi:hypothetical protein